MVTYWSELFSCNFRSNKSTTTGPRKPVGYADANPFFFFTNLQLGWIRVLLGVKAQIELGRPLTAPFQNSNICLVSPIGVHFDEDVFSNGWENHLYYFTKWDYPSAFFVARLMWPSWVVHRLNGHAVFSLRFCQWNHSQIPLWLKVRRKPW